jgi:hypothetical protein
LRQQIGLPVGGEPDRPEVTWLEALVHQVLGLGGNDRRLGWEYVGTWDLSDQTGLYQLGKALAAQTRAFQQVGLIHGLAGVIEPRRLVTGSKRQLLAPLPEGEL